MKIGGYASSPAKLEKETQQLENRITKMFEFLKADKKMHPKNMRKIHRNEDKFLNVCSSLKDAFLLLPETNDVLQNQLITSADSVATQDICTYEAEDIKAFVAQIHREREYYRSENLKVERKCLTLLTKITELSQQLKERGTNRFFKRGLRTPSTTVSTSSFDYEGSIEILTKDYTIVKLKMECEERLIAAEAVHSSLEEQIRLLKSQVNMLTAENEDLHALSAKQDQNELTLIKILEGERSADNSHKQRLRKLEDELDKKQELLIEKESDLMSKERKLRKIELDAKRLQKHSMMADVVEENSQLKYDIATLKREIATKKPQHHTMVADVFDDNSTLKQQVASLEKQLYNSDMKSKYITADLSEENTKLKEKVRILEKEASDGVLMSDDYAKLLEKSDNLQHSLHESERYNLKLKEELETVKVRRDKFHEVSATVKALEKQLAEQKSETSRLWKIVTKKASSNQNEVGTDHEMKIDNAANGKRESPTILDE